MKCPECDKQLRQNAKYCTSCGARVTGRKKKKEVAGKKKSKAHTSKKVPLPLIIGGAVIIVVAGLLIYQINANRQMQGSSSLPVYSENVQQVAAKLMCPCGDCNDNLALCTCTAPNGSVDVKKFIQEGLSQGKSMDQMVTAVQLKYDAELDESRRY